MAEADLRLIQRWVRANPGTGLIEDDVPGSTVDERGALSSLGRIAGVLLREFEPSTSGPARLLAFCRGHRRVADWFEGRDAPAAPGLVESAARRLLLDDGEDGLARLYAGLVSPARRRRLGTFFTPKHEVERMISSWSRHDLEPRSVIDVGAGVGIYTVASAKAWPTSEVFAVDVNPVTLGLLALRVASLKQDLQVTMVLSDFAQWVSSTWDELPSPRLVLGNPPYTRMQLLPEQMRDELMAMSGGMLGRRASLASLLTVVSLRLLGPADGVCLLLPAQWLESDYAKGMREWLWQAERRRVELRLFSSAIFKDAEVDAVSLLVGPEQADAQQLTVTVDGSGLDTAIVRKSANPARWRDFFRESARLASEQNGEVHNAAQHDYDAGPEQNGIIDDASPRARTGADHHRESPATPRPSRPEIWSPTLFATASAGDLLADLASVGRGVATGSNGFFVLTESQRSTWRLPKSALVPVVRRLRTGDAVRQHEWLYDPEGPAAGTGRTVGELAWLLVTGAAPTSLRVGRYLVHGQELEVDKSVLAGLRPDWYDLTPLLRPVDVALSPMSKGTFRLLPMPAGAAILNNLYGLRWNADVPPERREAVLRFLTSDSGQKRIASLARSQASGLLKIEPRALAHIVVPTQP